MYLGTTAFLLLSSFFCSPPSHVAYTTKATSVCFLCGGVSDAGDSGVWESGIFFPDGFFIHSNQIGGHQQETTPTFAFSVEFCFAGAIGLLDSKTSDRSSVSFFYGE
ncbi:unnamed protein product [Lactuca virosa]|uniref:Secreted protein n=1 Tax=Lactuca virosa TaxID=75947 RepID=A0AAU9P1V0_9ASTR|nr:unnamed protein product [Lactuca virosa]